MGDRTHGPVPITSLRVGRTDLGAASAVIDDECLILRWVESGKTTPEAAVAFGAALARTHLFGADQLGAAHDGFIGRLPMPNRTAPTWPEFFAVRRILPYLKLARDRGLATEQDAANLQSMIGALIANGLQPDDVAQQVFDAVVANRLYVLTHPDWSNGIVRNVERMVGGENPVMDIPQV